MVKPYDLDIASLSRAVESLISKTKTSLGVADTPAPNPSSEGSGTKARYNFAVDASVSLSNRWDIVEGLVLIDVSLRLRAEKRSGEEAIFRVRMTASAVIGGANFFVSAEIPSLMQGAPVDFVIELMLASGLDTIDPASLVAAFSGSRYAWATGLDALNPSLRSQISNDGRGSVTTATIWIAQQRENQGSFSLKSITFDFSANLSWELIPNQVTFSELRLSAVLSRQQGTGANTDAEAWQVRFTFGARGTFQEGVDVLFQGFFQRLAGGQSALRLTADVPTGGKPDALRLLGNFHGKSSTELQTEMGSRIPPAAGEDLDKATLDPFFVQLDLQTDADGWFLTGAEIRLLWQRMIWCPSNAVPSVFLESLLVHLGVRRLAGWSTAGSTPPEPVSHRDPVAYSALLGGTLMIFDTALSAEVEYRSAHPSSRLAIRCAIDRTLNLSLNDMARDKLLTSGQPHDLAGEAAARPVPDCVPVDLEWCKSRTLGLDRFFSLVFRDNQLLLVQFGYRLAKMWDVTPWLRIDQMGLYFEIREPLSARPSIMGYSHGQVTLAGGRIKLYALVGGVKDAAGAAFRVGLRSRLALDEPLSDAPLEILRAMNDDKPIDVEKWTLPETVPSQTTVAQLASNLEARMSMDVVQKIDPTHPDLYHTRIMRVAAALSLRASWNIVTGVVLEDVRMRFAAVYGDDPAAKASAYQVELEGTISATSALSMVGEVGYVVKMRGVFRQAEWSTLGEKNKTADFVVLANAYSAVPGIDRGYDDDEAVALSTFLRTNIAGGKDVSQDANAQTFPPELAKPADLLATKTSVAECSMRMSKASGAWAISQITASYRQGSMAPWLICGGKIAITNSALALVIRDPRGPNRSVTFVATTTIRIGDIGDLSATVTAKQRTGANSSQVSVLSLVIEATSARKVLNALVGPINLDTPPRAPELGIEFHGSITVECLKTDGEADYRLNSVKMLAGAATTKTWTLGPFSEMALTLSVVVDKMGTEEETAAVSFVSHTVVKSTPVNCAISWTKPPNPQDSKLTITIQSNIDPATAVGFFTGAGQPSLQEDHPPPVSRDLGLASYVTSAVSGIQVEFVTKNASWVASSLSAGIRSQNQSWALVKNILWAEDLYLTLTVSNLSNPSKRMLSVKIGISLYFQKRIPDEVNGLMRGTLEVTARDMQLALDISQCSLLDFIYVASAGYLRASDPPDFVFPWIKPKLLTVTLSWDRGTGSVSAFMDDWTLPGKLSKLAVMKSPHLTMKITRMSGGLSAKGEIAGTVSLAGDKITCKIAYGLPNGPFSLCGIPVQRAKEFAQKLYNALRAALEVEKAAEEVVAIAAELAAYEGLADITAGILAGLTLAGVAAKTVEKLIKDFFHVFTTTGSGPGGTSGDAIDLTKNHQGPLTLGPSLILGGIALSPGPAAEAVNLFVYPKTHDGTFIALANLDSLTLTVFDDSGAQKPPVVITQDWTAVIQGYAVSFQRPATAGRIVVGYGGVTPPLSAGFRNVMEVAPSEFSLANSDIIYPVSAPLFSRCEIRIVPRDQYGQLMLGPDAVPATVGVAVVNNDAEAPTQAFGVESSTRLVRFNDCAVFPFTLLSRGTYRLSVVYEDQDGHAAVIEGFPVASAEHSVAFGPGLCTGAVGETTEIYVDLRDQAGTVLPSAPNVLDGLQHQMDGVEVVMAMLPIDMDMPPILFDYGLDATDGSSRIKVAYTRPSTPCVCSIMISAQGSPFPNAPFLVAVTDVSVSVMTDKWTFNTWNPVQATVDPIKPPGFAVGDTLQLEVTPYDSLGNRCWAPFGGHAQITNIRGLTPTPADSKPTVGKDGVIRFSAIVSAAAADEINMDFVASMPTTTQTVVRNLSFRAMPARNLSRIEMSGSGLNANPGGTGAIVEIVLRGYDQYGARHRVNRETNCRIQVVGSGAVTVVEKDTKISDHATVIPYSLGLTGESSGSLITSKIVVILQPLASSSFRELIAVVPVAERSMSADGAASFLIWDELNATGISTATLVAIDQHGWRRHVGGDSVEAVSLATAMPISLLQPIEDRNDGTYRVQMMLPAEASTPQADPAKTPLLRVSLNKQIVSEVSFPLPSPPMVDARIRGAMVGSSKLPDLVAGTRSLFVLECLDAAGNPASYGFRSAQVYLMDPESPDSRLVPTEVGTLDGSTISVQVQVPPHGASAKTTYHCHVFLNTRPVSGSPFVLEVTNPAPTKPTVEFSTIEHVGEGNWLANPDLWKVERPGDWSLNPTDSPGGASFGYHCIVLSGTGGSSSKPISFTLNPPFVDSWFENGFVLSLDVQIEAWQPTHVIFEPQPEMRILLSYRPRRLIRGGLGAALGEWVRDFTPAGPPALLTPMNSQAMFLPPYAPGQRLEVSNITCVYTLTEEDEGVKVYTMHVFHGGQYIESVWWPRSEASSNMPNVGFSIKTGGSTPSQPAVVRIASIKTLPTRFDKAAPPSPNPTATNDVNLCDSDQAGQFISLDGPSRAEVLYTPEGMVTGDKRSRTLKTTLSFDRERPSSPQAPLRNSPVEVSMYSFTVTDLNRADPPEHETTPSMLDPGALFNKVHDLQSEKQIWKFLTNPPARGNANEFAYRKRQVVVIVQGVGCTSVFFLGRRINTVLSNFDVAAASPNQGIEGPAVTTRRWVTTWHGMRNLSPLTKIV